MTTSSNYMGKGVMNMFPGLILDAYGRAWQKKIQDGKDYLELWQRRRDLAYSQNQPRPMISRHGPRTQDERREDGGASQLRLL